MWLPLKFFCLEKILLKNAPVLSIISKPLRVLCAKGRFQNFSEAWTIVLNILLCIESSQRIFNDPLPRSSRRQWCISTIVIGDPNRIGDRCRLVEKKNKFFFSWTKIFFKNIFESEKFFVNENFFYKIFFQKIKL